MTCLTVSTVEMSAKKLLSVADEEKEDSRNFESRSPSSAHVFGNEITMVTAA